MTTRVKNVNFKLQMKQKRKESNNNKSTKKEMKKNEWFVLTKIRRLKRENIAITYEIYEHARHYR